MFEKAVYINASASIHPPVNQPAVWTPGQRLQAEEPDYKQLITNAGVRRRMSRIVRMGVAAGLLCLQEKQPDAILTATGLGCLEDTEKFMQNLLDNEGGLLPPTAFIQSTFNTIGGQIALLLGNHGYNNTYVHRGFSLESAILDAALLLTEGSSRQVLVGSIDEQTDTLYHILERLGYWRNSMAGEGASFFLLSDTPSADCLAELKAIEMISSPTPPEETTISSFLERHHAEGATLIRPGEFKQYCGEYPTAMGFGLWYACRQMREKGLSHLLLQNSFLDNHSFILLKQR
ncbi:beta-ketoacyl synthase chain length factor [Parabacteroides sp. OttesenSCG-928-G06]|nr:beta-ketoacyl synthase chain length factor [Parabacteroides sp. OttesenSCG-928-K15]MDL2282642.1 beta-ketoacyl synthase chain length factor [Parabacteroides sp. OttesenSCG-928-G06]